jgi:hypothetical protein
MHLNNSKTVLGIVRIIKQTLIMTQFYFYSEISRYLVSSDCFIAYHSERLHCSNDHKICLYK